MISPIFVWPTGIALPHRYCAPLYGLISTLDWPPQTKCETDMKKRAVTARENKKKPKSPIQKRNESDDFISVARRLGADEDKATFEAKLAKIAKSKSKT
jgi:hypothetical protein